MFLVAAALATIVAVVQAHSGQDQAQPYNYVPAEPVPIQHQMPMQPQGMMQPQVIQPAPAVYYTQPRVVYPPPSPPVQEPRIVHTHTNRDQARAIGAIAPAPIQVPPAPVYGYIPPSPLLPRCPRDYTCCENVKHYDPSGIKMCCGSKSYIPRLQSCNRGSVVSILQAAPPPTTTPVPIFVQREELPCQNIVWKVPHDTFKCCGPLIYNFRTEKCNIPETPTRPTGAPAVEPLYTAPPSTAAPTTTTAAPGTSGVSVLPCGNRRFEVPTVDYQFYACCGSEAYFWVREQCLNGQVSPPRTPTTTTSATPEAVPTLMVCDNTEHWVSSSVRQFMGCCGNQIYDYRISPCYPSPPGAPSPAPAPGPAPSSCPTSYICCEDYPPVADLQGTLACCPNIGPYDPTLSNCPTTGKRK